ncbi:oxidoreductase FAD-binding domain-containing protein [Isoalcanivorax pacificus W11-5]|uniref:Oxidoreductase FAD-binding domain-containing protein n=1 Tax=Isoalcanivorax pacificus W11-5 TaxID=391936 RepID=A0A0B4XK87_9GAMM|nr:ferredoxin reductase [Isoalcanivorax pacificus]AJD47496.1 oxidoreductase FAD-binding domain-containing protein [Isoalcanivorax pacificus W11-5]
MTTSMSEPKPSKGWLAKLSTITDMFAYPLRTSHYVELVNPLWTTHRMHARVVEVWDETRDCRTITLQPGANWRLHRPGQHIRVGIPVDGRHYTRTYTISSPPERDDGRFTITVKKIDGGRLSHHIVRHLKVGDHIPVGLPQGDFYLPDASPIQPLFITAGSGITPAMSMLRSLIAQQRLPDTVHIHYAPHEFDTIFGKELRKLDAGHRHYHLHEVHTRKQDGRAAHFSRDALEKFCPDWRERDCYACGPPGLLAALEQTWEDAGLSNRLHIERFRAELAPIPDDAVGGKVRFARSGVDVDADGQTNLLRLAEDAGLNPPHGCRMGICHTCNTTLKSGCVRDLRSGAFINEPGAIVQVCVCATAGDCELDI